MGKRVNRELLQDVNKTFCIWFRVKHGELLHHFLVEVQVAVYFVEAVVVVEEEVEEEVALQELPLLPVQHHESAEPFPSASLRDTASNVEHTWSSRNVPEVYDAST